MKPYLFIFVCALLNFPPCEAAAFWGSDSTDSVSGLNVAAGFDVNTIATITGTVVTPPEHKGGEQHTVMAVATAKGAVSVVLGPWSYWEKQAINVTQHQELAITGSLAQGKDGAFYLFAQRVENHATGESVTLRSESGKPLWSGAGSGTNNAFRRYGANAPRSGAANRGGGMRGGRR
jgi:hypothetical protein